MTIRTIKKHCEGFQCFIESLNFKFSAICYSETWLHQPHEISDSNFQLSGYYRFHLTREKNRGGRICIFLQETHSYKSRKDRQVNSKAFECLWVGVENKNSRNVLLNLVYHLWSSDHKELQNYLKSSLSKQENSHKDVFCYVRFGTIPTINKSTRVARQNTSATDHIITNSIIPTGFKSGIIKTDISNHFQIFFCYKYIAEKEYAKKEFTYKRRFSDQSIETFKLRLRDINWSKVRLCRNANEACIIFLTLLIHYIMNASQ